MSSWKQFASTVNGARIISALGTVYVLLAAAKVTTVVTAGGTLTSAIADFVLIGAPGLALVYGGSWIRQKDVPRDLYPRILAWCLSGFVGILVILQLVNLEPGVIITDPRWTFLLATSLGTAIGFALGVNDVRAVVQAREVEGTNQKLEQANRELKRQNDRLENFASMLAHELRNPLNIAQIYLPQVSDGKEEAVKEVEAAHERIEEMIEILLVTARKVESDVDAEETVALADVTTAAWADVHANRVDLTVETDQRVRANSVHLRHLFENLFKNSVEHGSTSSQPKADDSVEHGGESLTIRVGDLEDGFYVEDDGAGIPAEERGDVFEAGYTTGGIGFGLTFVSRIIEIYDWDCEITESESGGARFEFTGVALVPDSEHTGQPQRH